MAWWDRWVKLRIENNLPWVFAEGQICEERHTATVDMRREVPPFISTIFTKACPAYFY